MILLVYCSIFTKITIISLNEVNLKRKYHHNNGVLPKIKLLAPLR